MSIGTARSSACVFVSGHSLTDQIGVPMQLVANSAGWFFDHQEHMILGSAVSLRTSGVTDPNVDDTWPGYRMGTNRQLPSGVRALNLDLVAHFRNVTAANGKETNAPYSALLLAEGHHLYRAQLFNLSTPLHRHYYELIREGSPSCEGYLYATWLSHSEPATKTGSGPDVICEYRNSALDDLLIEMQSGGPLGVATFRWSINGGATWEQSGVVTAQYMDLPGGGHLILEQTGDFVSGTLYEHSWTTGLSYWTSHMREQQAATAAISSRINLSLAYEGRTDRLVTAPTALALANLLDAATTGAGLPGITIFDGGDIDVRATRGVIVSDSVHMTEHVGRYFLGCVCYSTVYRRDCRGLAHPPEISSTTAESLQQVAWDSIVEYFDERPMGDQFTQEELLDAFSAHLPRAMKMNGDSHHYAGFSSYLSGSESPLRFNASTDEAVWFAPPPGGAVGAPNSMGNAALFAAAF